MMGDALRDLAAVVDTLDEAGVEVVAASPQQVTDDGTFTADLRVRMAVGEGETIVASGKPEPGEDEQAESGEDVNEAAVTEIVAEAPSGDQTQAESSGAGATDDKSDGEEPSADGVACTHADCAETFDTEHGMRIHRSKAHETDADPSEESLQQVYEAHDSFAAMREALDVDVTAQTIRRRMIDAGIHTPGDRSGANVSDVEREEASDENEATEVGVSDTKSESGEPTEGEPATEEPEVPDDTGEPAEADGPEVQDEAGPPGGNDTRDGDARGASRRTPPGIDHRLPDGVTAATLRETVEEATTLYEVQRSLRMDRSSTRQLLGDLDLLELVHGRVSDQDRREELKDEIDERLRAAASPADSPSD